MTDQLPSKDVDDAPRPVWSEAVQDDIYYASEIDPYIQRLREDLVRTESARVAILAENKHYKQEAAEANQLLNSEWFQRVTYKQQLRAAHGELDQLRKRLAQPPGDGQ